MDRTVRHLRLRAPTAQAAAHAAHRLEDALRCASLPDPGARVLLVRRLHLGRLPAGLSPQSLSLLIERRVAAVGGEWVPGDDEARAARSNTVFFASRLQAAQAALRRRANGHALDGWFWPLALPGVEVRASAQVFLSQLLDSVQGWPESPAAMPVLIDEAQAVGQGAWWHAHLPPLWRDRLAPEMRYAPKGGRALSPHGATPLPVRVPAQARRTPGTRPAGPPEPPGAGAWPASALRTGRAQALTGSPQDAARDTAQTPMPTPHGAVKGLRTAPAAAGVAGSASAAQEGPGAPSPTSGASARMPTAQRFEPVRAALAVGSDQPAGEPWLGAQASAAGGLLFLWPVLERLGLTVWDARHPDDWLAPRVLGQALSRLRVPASDPAWALCASLPRPPDMPPGPDAQAALWLRACRRQLSQVPRFGVARLVIRPARLRWSATHIDVHFHLRDADLRVRRAALDTDPGWVDALQRVVGFHYDLQGPVP